MSTDLSAAQAEVAVRLAAAFDEAGCVLVKLPEADEAVFADEGIHVDTARSFGMPIALSIGDATRFMSPRSARELAGALLAAAQAAEAGR